jgi:peptidoglycan/xylan/chitin deacetylase (PgdA/CDA1 family)
VLTVGPAACIMADAVEDEDSTEAVNPGGKAESLFADGPMYLTGAFDGSKRFGMWVETMEFARHIERTYGKRLSWTYFINTCYFDHTVTGSAIGRARSLEETIVRWALTQQAANEGHEIGNHSVRHKDGSSWSYDQWYAEFDEFHRLAETKLFEPIREPGQGSVFPKWRPMPGAAPREVGAACQTDGDCNSGMCLPVAEDASFCTAPCNRYKPCANGTICGAPDWNESTDRCVPMPEFPVEYHGEVLFDEYGNANLAHPDLKPYRMVGFRAPQLGHNRATFDVLREFKYKYDTSKILQVGPPKRVVHGGVMFDGLYEFALMKNPGSLTIPMDYNYKVNNGGTGERMLEDYKRSIVDSYNQRERQPWNIGHHFALWNGGSYWWAMKEAFVFAAEGCPDAGGQRRCDNVEFPTFEQLAMHLDAKTDGIVDPFADPNVTDAPPEQGSTEHSEDAEEY